MSSKFATPPDEESVLTHLYLQLVNPNSKGGSLGEVIFDCLALFQKTIHHLLLSLEKIRRQPLVNPGLLQPCKETCVTETVFFGEIYIIKF